MAFSAGLDTDTHPPGLSGGQPIAGENVQGEINGVTAEGNGQLLKIPEGSGPTSGLRLFVKLNESQLDPNAMEANITITKGVGSRLASYLESVVNPLTGSMKRITKNLRDTIGDLDEQLDRMEERIESKRERIQTRFERMESRLSTLKSQQAFMKSQMGNVSQVLPGLPG